MIDFGDRSTDWRQSRWLAVGEMVLVIGIFTADRYGLIPLSNTPFLLLLAWISLRVRRLGWRDVGCVRPHDWRRAVAVGSVAGISMELLALFVTEPLIANLAGAHPDVSDFRPLVGNLRLLLLLLPLMWLVAAFGEEVVYRGYLMNRAGDLAPGGRGQWLIALIVSSALFGWAHGESQGGAGTIQEGFAGLLLGVLYLSSARTLAVPMIAHGMSNTLAFVLIYFGRYPGL